MKVTKRGVPPSEKVWAGKCSKCGSEMEEMETNLANPTHNQRDGHSAKELCPVCGDSFWMYPKRIQPVQGIREPSCYNSSFQPELYP